MEGFLRYRIGGLIFGGAYFRNFTVVFLNNQVFARLSFKFSPFKYRDI